MFLCIFTFIFVSLSEGDGVSYPISYKAAVPDSELENPETQLILFDVQ